MLSTSLIAAVLSAATLVSAHGSIFQVRAAGKTYPGNNPYGGDNGQTPVRKPFRYEGDGAYLLPRQWNTPRVACEDSNSAGAAQTIEVRPGDYLEVEWQGATGELKGSPGAGRVSNRNPWVHAIGTIAFDITRCSGSAKDCDVSNSGWTRLQGNGFDPNGFTSQDLKNVMASKPEPVRPDSGLWAMANFVQAGSVQSIQIPNLAPGEYIGRSELIALHNPLGNGGSSGGQLYAGCIQLKVVGNGDLNLPAGTQASQFYAPDGPLARYSPYNGDSASKFPGNWGPAVWDQVSSGPAPTPAPPADDNNNDSGNSENNNSNNGGSSNAPAESGNNNGAPAEPVAPAASAPEKKCKNRRARRSLDAGSHRRRHAVNSL